MFYSQFILAKKGPLGTIWIAAHLERKLRKNQVADTDIGVSVDSILFPDAPIALRLSSHLLLGVVRIYSKKVNYLFNDCSEALIKIKHAFRSTAVDLPPEESTAPYNSITLPENFDLDNFELPDSACLDSNFVDHHVSTREQITLQDTVNDSTYPTTKFGLDERFGDEDAAQIGLELDEELFTEKKISPQHDEVSMSLKLSGLHHGETSVPTTTMEMDAQFGYDEEKGSEIPNELSELLSNNFGKNCFSIAEELRRDANSSHRHGYTIQTPDLNEVFQPECHTGLSPRISFTPDEVITPCLVDHAQEPSTPGLLEVVPSNFQEVPALSPLEKTKAHVESCRPQNCCSPYMEVESAEAGNETVLVSAELGHKAGETAQELPLTSVLTSPTMPESLAPAYSNWNLTTDVVCLVSGAECQQSGLTGNEVSNISTADRRLDNEKAINPSSFSHEAINLSSISNLTVHFEAEPVTSSICTDDKDVSRGISDVKRTQHKDSKEPSKVTNLRRVEDGDSCITTSVDGSYFLSRTCGSNLHASFLHGVPSLFPQEAINFSSPIKVAARFEPEPVTSNIYTDNIDVSGGIFSVKRTQKKDCNEPSQIANLCRVEDGDSFISSSGVGSDFLSRSCGSNMHPIFFHGDPTGFSYEAVNLIPPRNLEAHCEVEPVISNICADNMDVLGVMTQKKDGNAPTQIANLGRVEDGDSCISISVVGSDFVSRSSGSNLHPIFSHCDPSGFSHETVKMTSLPKLGDPSACSNEAINLTSPPTNLAERFEVQPVTSNRTDNMVVAGSISIVKVTQNNDGKEPSQIANLGCAEDGDPCVSTSVVGSDFLSRSGSSNLHLSCSILADGALGEASEFSLRDHSCSLKTPMREELLHNFRSSFEVQGEDLRYINDRVPNLEGQHRSRCTPSDFNYGASKMDELSMGVFSKVTHFNNVKIPSSSEFQGPEKMLALSFAVDLPTYQGLQASDKGVAESDGSIDRNSSHSRKRREMDSTAVLQTGSSAKLSGIPRSRRSADYVPADDDVLVSILAGKTVPSLEIGSITSLSKVPSQKRPRMMSRVGMHKRRKVLMDDAMVLHADAIRQQLINTEDIRRIRKKAPCTKPEIWKIYMGAMEDDIFYHSLLTGIALELNSVYDLKYGIQKDPSSQATEYNSRVKTSGETGSSRVSEFINEMGDKEIGERISFLPGIVDRSENPLTIAAFDTVHTHKGGAQCDLHDILDGPPVRPQAGPFSNEQESVIRAMQPDADIYVDSIIQVDAVPEINKSISSFENVTDESINLAERSLHNAERNPPITNDVSARDESANMVGIDGDAVVAVISESPIKPDIACNAAGAIAFKEERTGLVLDVKLPKSSHTLSNDGDSGGAFVGIPGHALPDSGAEFLLEKTNGSDVVVDIYHAAEALGDGERPVIDATCAEVDNFVCVPSSLEDAPSTMDKNSCIQNFNLEDGLDVDNVPVDADADADATRDSSDFCSAIDDDYTGFLIEDEDGADFDEAENDVPNTEDAQSLENSGWSARTRGVARYLKNLFDEESGQGRKFIVVNRLLAGKTRKEASRMFFETLVLKTRDYIQVEQEKPLEYIQIKPRIKLLKSEF